MWLKLWCKHHWGIGQHLKHNCLKFYFFWVNAANLKRLNNFLCLDCVVSFLEACFILLTFKIIDRSKQHSIIRTIIALDMLLTVSMQLISWILFQPNFPNSLSSPGLVFLMHTHIVHCAFLHQYLINCHLYYGVKWQFLQCEWIITH